MNSLLRLIYTRRHLRKLAKYGKHCRFPIPDMHVFGHVEVGDHCRFRNNATLRTYGEGRIIFHERSGVSWGCYLEAWDRIEIGPYSGIAEYTVVTDTSPLLFGDEISWRTATRNTRPVRIEPNCFVGSNCFIGPGVTIHEGAVIAPFSVVLSDVGPYEIWSGVPARKVAHRTEGVPAARLAEVAALIAEQGIQKDRYRE
jgi:acetyltransferase-like isoleucine patch superfamily enzyme